MSLTQSLYIQPTVKFTSQRCAITSFPSNIRTFRNIPRIFSECNDSINIPTRRLGHPLASKIPTMDRCNGDVGILDFFEGKNIFITGSSAVGIALVEKLLRSTKIGKVYLLVKASHKEVAIDRLLKEVINSELYKCLRKKHGDDYEEFVREKLIFVVGNISEKNLGMDSDSGRKIMEEVDVIVNSGDNMELTESYDHLIDANVRGPQRLIGFAKMCKNLRLFVHLSSAYVNGRREEGTIYEEPLFMGENDMYPMNEFLCGYDIAKELEKLSQERAWKYGWCNSYQMSKAMGEMFLNEIRGDVPVLIIRPTIIGSTYRDPFPGWIQHNSPFDPLVINAYKALGQLPSSLAQIDPQDYIDIVPIDMVVNVMIAATAKHGNANSKPNLNVCHVMTGVKNVLQFSEFFEYIVMRLSKREQYEYVKKFCEADNFTGIFNPRFHNGNTWRLSQEMSEEEKLEFGVDVGYIDWSEYF